METNSYWRSTSKVHMGTSFFLAYGNDMPNGLKSNVKLFADSKSIFGIVKNKNDIAKDLTHQNGILSGKCFLT